MFNIFKDIEERHRDSLLPLRAGEEQETMAKQHYECKMLKKKVKQLEKALEFMKANDVKNNYTILKEY